MRLNAMIENRGNYFSICKDTKDGVFFHILESAKLAINFFMMEPIFFTFIYILDSTYFSSTYIHMIHPKLYISSKYV